MEICPRCLSDHSPGLMAQDTASSTSINSTAQPSKAQAFPKTPHDQRDVPGSGRAVI